MPSKATSVAEYLAELPVDRRAALSVLRKLVLKHLPKSYTEAMNWGMICYEVPLSIESRTSNGQPLLYAALASQKNHMAVYLCSLGCMPEEHLKFEKAWKGKKKLDMGKSCLRFKNIEDIDLDLIGQSVASTQVETYVSAFKKHYAKAK